MDISFHKRVDGKLTAAFDLISIYGMVKMEVGNLVCRRLTPEEIQGACIRSRVDTTILTTEGSFFELHSKPVAYVLSELYHKLDAQIPISFVDETSGKYIDKRAGEFGITRKPGYKATVTLTVTGTMGCRIPAGTPFQTEDGLRFLFPD